MIFGTFCNVFILSNAILVFPKPNIYYVFLM